MFRIKPSYLKKKTYNKIYVVVTINIYSIIIGFSSVLSEYLVKGFWFCLFKYIFILTYFNDSILNKNLLFYFSKEAENNTNFVKVIVLNKY